MKVIVDTNVLVRHLTGEPPAMARRAAAFLGSAVELHLADLSVAELVFVLESFYELPRARVVELIRATIALENIVVEDDRRLLRALVVYEDARLHFAEAYLVARAEATGDGAVASFDRSIDRVNTVERIEP